MKSFSESIFLKSPVLVQNFLISLYGLKLVYERFGGDYNKYYQDANQRRSWSKKDIDLYSESSLQKLINIAAKTAPYYKELFIKHKIKPEDIRSVDDLQKIPLLEKEELRKNPEKFVSNLHSFQKLSCIHTTGSTGTPLKIYCNPDIRQKNFAYFSRFLNDVGINYHGRRVTLWGRIIMNPEDNRPPFWRYSLFQKNLLMSSYHLSPENMPDYIDKIVQFKPDYIDSYPSSIYSIAKYAQENRIDLKKCVGGITTSAETLLPEQRNTIENVFGVPVYDQYGAAEMCVFVSQCKKGSYHIHSDYGILEFLRDDGSPAGFNEEGEIVCTGLINTVMPFIRYRIGDRGVLSDQTCDCGSPFPVIKQLLGRTDDYIITPEGNRVGRLSPVLKGFPVKEGQFVQTTQDRLVVNLVKGEGFNDDIENDIVHELRKRLGESINIDIMYCPTIERGPGGKLRSIISRL